MKQESRILGVRIQNDMNKTKISKLSKLAEGVGGKISFWTQKKSSKA